MNIDRPSESSLLLALTEAIQSAQVNSWGWVSLPNDWESRVKSGFDESFRKRLYRNLDEGGLQSLVRDFIRCEAIYAKIEYPDKDSDEKFRPITQYPRFADALSVGREILDIIRNLPRDYLICVPAFTLDKKYFGSDFHLKISDRLSLISFSKLPENFQFRSEVNEIDRHVRNISNDKGGTRFFEEGSILFTYRTSGLISDRNRPKCFIDFYDDLRAFYGACLSLDVMGYSSIFRTGRVYPVHGNMLKNNALSLELVEALEEDLQDISDSYLSASAEDRLNKGETIEQLFSTVCKMFKSDQYQRLRTSAIWLFRSFHAERGMDQILDATIAIEVLLGDRDASDRIGLSKLMANRCAYALGRSASERNDLYKFFTEFYKLRSEIVHSGRLKISEEEAKLVRKGVALASRVLRHEIAMN